MNHQSVEAIPAKEYEGFFSFKNRPDFFSFSLFIRVVELAMYLLAASYVLFNDGDIVYKASYILVFTISCLAFEAVREGCLYKKSTMSNALFCEKGGFWHALLHFNFRVPVTFLLISGIYFSEPFLVFSVSLILSHLAYTFHIIIMNDELPTEPYLLAKNAPYLQLAFNSIFFSFLIVFSFM